MPALSRTCSRAGLWLWPGQALYAGPSLGLGVHSGSVACLAVGVDAPVVVHVPGRPDLTARSVLVPPRLPHRLIAQGERMVFCYLDPASPYAAACRTEMLQGDVLPHTHRQEAALVHLAFRLDERRPADGALWLARAAPAPSPSGTDERIRAATRRLLGNPETAVTARELAAEAGLSVSRFLHLFKAQTGTSFRRYRIWARMLRAAALLDEGHDLTRVAVEAGFSSPSHLSGTFHATFGLTPSALLAVDPDIVRGDAPPAGRTAQSSGGSRRSSAVAPVAPGSPPAMP
ncbi:AraC family transcriptional regulator [Spirillospora sp. NPDC052242]